VRPDVSSERRAEDKPACVWARVVPRDASARATLERTGWLTPYTAKEIAEDPLSAGPGARLEMVADMSRAKLAEVKIRFAWLGDRGSRSTFVGCTRSEAQASADTEEDQ